MRNKTKNSRYFYGFNKFRLPGTNYCGPGWSDGKWTASRVGSAPALSRTDQACKNHDASYARGEDRTAADWRFSREVKNPLIGYAPLLGNKLLGNNNMRQRHNSTPTPRTPHSRERSMSMSSASMRSHRSYGSDFPSSAGGGNSIVTKATGKPMQVKPSTKGISYFFQSGGQISEGVGVVGKPVSHTLYIGVTTRSMFNEQVAVWAALVKKLYQKAGYVVPELDTAIVIQSGTTKYVWVNLVVTYPDTNTLGGYDGPQVTGGQSINQIATAIAGNMAPSGLNTEGIVFQQLELREGTTGSDFNQIASIDLRHVIVHQKVVSHMKVQNNTLGANIASTQQFTDTLTACPLSVTEYHVNQGSFAITGDNRATSALESLYGYGKSDPITYKGSFFNRQANFSGTDTNQLETPPSKKTVMNCTKVKSTTLQPGGILIAVVEHKSSFSLHKMYQEKRLSNTTDKNTTIGEYGRCVWLGLTKTIDGLYEKTPPVVTWQTEVYLETSVSSYLPKTTNVLKVVADEIY